MFKVKDKNTKQIVQVLHAYPDDLYGKTWFLIWSNGWRWRAADNFVPPNYEEEEESSKT